MRLLTRCYGLLATWLRLAKCNLVPRKRGWLRLASSIASQPSIRLSTFRYLKITNFIHNCEQGVVHCVQDKWSPNMDRNWKIGNARSVMSRKRLFAIKNILFAGYLTHLFSSTGMQTRHFFHNVFRYDSSSHTACNDILIESEGNKTFHVGTLCTELKK